MKYILTAGLDGTVSLAPYPEPVAPAPVPSTLLAKRGCNLTGGSTAYTDWSQTTGPIKGTHYKFIPLAEAGALVDAGMNTFRPRINAV